MKHKTLIAAALLSVVGLASVFTAPPASADGCGEGVVNCPYGSLHNKDGNTPCHSEFKTVAQCNLPANETAADGSEKDIIWYIGAVINAVLGLVGIVAVVVMIVGGISFITSQGDPGKVTKARNTILYGVIGIVVALLAFAIVNFVLKSIGSANSEAHIPSSSLLAGL